MYVKFYVNCADGPIHGGFRHEEAGQSLEIRNLVRGEFVLRPSILIIIKKKKKKQKCLK